MCVEGSIRTDVGFGFMEFRNTNVVTVECVKFDRIGGVVFVLRHLFWHGRSPIKVNQYVSGLVFIEILT